jgi:hypothetical protein
MCKFDLRQHFEEQRAAVEIIIPITHINAWRDRLLQGRRLWRWGRIQADENQLLAAGEEEEEGDLELTEEPSTIINSEQGVIV